MKSVDWLRERITNLLKTPGEELGSWARLLRFQMQMWWYCYQRLRANNVMAMSAALSFRTIFTLVPVLVLSFMMLKPLGAVTNSRQIMHEVLAQAGLTEIYVEQTQPGDVPAWEQEDPLGTFPPPEQYAAPITVADQVEGILMRFENQLTFSRLGPIGVILLIWTALTLLTTMERCLNRVFEAPRSRSLIRRVLVYWTTLTLGPLLLIVVIFLAKKVGAAFESTPVLSWLIPLLLWCGPVLMGIALLAALYTLMPNKDVRFRPAMTGALLAVPLWLLGRWAFVLYVEHFGKTSVYGALGLVPLFLMWLNFSWGVFLFGAQIAHAIVNVSQNNAPRTDNEIE
jgi:membrane protein